MSIRIHMLRTHYPHWGEHSGINQYLKYMDQKKFEIDMRLVSDGDADFPVKNRMVRSLLRYVVQKRGMEWYKLSDLAAEMNALRRCRGHQADIIHYLDGEHSAQFLPGIIKKLRKVRPSIIATYHQPPELFESLIRRDVIKWLDCITVVSPDQTSYFSELVEPDKVRLILHGIDIDHFKPGNVTKEKEKFKCITVGHWLRDFTALRKVAEKLKDNKLIEFSIVSSQASELADLPNVHIQSGIDDVRLLQLYQQSDIMFLPLEKCTANNALLEGIACGLPVVSTLIPSIKAYVPGHEAILIEKNDSERFAEAILHLAHNQDDRRKMAKLARKRAEQLDWRNIALQYENVYSKLAKEN